MSVTKILFICIGNTCRSPMAEAIARELGGDGLRVYSAGLTPTGIVADNAILALETLGYSGDGLSSKGLDQVPLAQMDVIVSLLGDSGLRFLPKTGARLVSWQIRDPIGDGEEVFLSVARTLEDRIRGLLDELAEELFLV